MQNMLDISDINQGVIYDKHGRGRKTVLVGQNEANQMMAYFGNQDQSTPLCNLQSSSDVNLLNLKYQGSGESHYQEQSENHPYQEIHQGGGGHIKLHP